MNTDLAAALLNQAANGAEMLQILETLSDADDDAAADDAGTLQEIQF